MFSPVVGVRHTPGPCLSVAGTIAALVSVGSMAHPEACELLEALQGESRDGYTQGGGPLAVGSCLDPRWGPALGHEARCQWLLAQK